MRSWMSEKAQTFRRLKGLTDEGGTAVTVQAMVFGNAGAFSGSGVGFTRDPDSGEKCLAIQVPRKGTSVNIARTLVVASCP